MPQAELTKVYDTRWWKLRFKCPLIPHSCVRYIRCSHKGWWGVFYSCEGRALKKFKTQEEVLEAAKQMLVDDVQSYIDKLEEAAVELKTSPVRVAQLAEAAGSNPV
jgi:hypothetical protein